MRVVGFAFGLLGFSLVALGGDGVLVKAPTENFQAEYVYGPGTSQETTISLSVNRKFSFYYPDASVDSTDHSRLAADPSDDIEEYYWDDVLNAAQSAKTPQELAQNLAALPRKTVDCRQTARAMVEGLVANRVNVTKPGTPAEKHQLQDREDQLDVLLAAKQLNSITIMRDPTIASSVNDPSFVCRQTTVGGEAAACGDLKIKFNPLEAPDGYFKGQKVAVLGAGCVPSNSDYKLCELDAQIQRCGLAATEKAMQARAAAPSTRGLSDFIETNIAQQARDLENGVTLPQGPGQSAALATAPDPVDPGFQVPSSTGSRQPAE